MTYWSDVHGANERRPWNSIALAMLYAHDVYAIDPSDPSVRLPMVERVLAGDNITLAGRSCRPSCADWSACTPYLPYAVHAEFMSVPSSSWLTSGKPPPVAYACGTVRYVRFGHDFSQESPLCLQPVMISGMSCVCAPRLREVSRTVAAM